MVEYIVAIDVTRVRFPADAFCKTRLNRDTEKKTSRAGVIRSDVDEHIFALGIYTGDSLAEQSKAPDSSSGGAIRVGSNPTAVLLFNQRLETFQTTTALTKVRPERFERPTV